MNNISPEYSLEKTMLGPFWARATYSLLYPELLNDAEAVRLLSNLENYYRDTHTESDYAVMQKVVDEFVGLDLLFRARSFDDAIRIYLDTHPRATVVNIGCGLDTAFSRVDNGQISWYDLDLPEAIAIRQKFMPEFANAPRCKIISKSAFDQSWFESVDYSRERGIFFILSGLLYYFTEKEVGSLLRAMTSRFSGGELIFDMFSKLGAKIWNLGLKKGGITGIDLTFSMNNPGKQLAQWDPNMHVVDQFPLFSRLKKNPKWKRKTRFLMAITSWFKIMNVIQVRFSR